MDPADAFQGSYWDHVIIDPETKLIVSLVVGKRDADTVVQVFTDFYGRTDGDLPELICTDEYAVYETVILDLSRQSRNQRNQERVSLLVPSALARGGSGMVGPGGTR